MEREQPKMTVGQLRDILAKVDPNLPIFVRVWDEEGRLAEWWEPEDVDSAGVVGTCFAIDVAQYDEEEEEDDGN